MGAGGAGGVVAVDDGEERLRWRWLAGDPSSEVAERFRFLLSRRRRFSVALIAVQKVDQQVDIKDPLVNGVRPGTKKRKCFPESFIEVG